MVYWREMRCLLPVLTLATASWSAAALELVSPGWMDEDARTFAGARAGTGTWSAGGGDAVAADGAIQFRARGEDGAFVTFTDAVPSPGNAVETEADFVPGGWADALPDLPADTQCSLAWLRDGLRVYSADGWTPVSGAGLLADGRGRHRLLTRFDYVAGTFSMKLDGTLLRAADGTAVFRLAGGKSAVRACAFAGGGAVHSLTGGGRTASPATVSAAEIHAACADLPAHPRLHVCGPAGLAAIRNDASPRAVLLRARVVEAAERRLSQPLSVFGKDAAGKRLTGDTAASATIVLCAAAHAFTDDPRHAARARDEMLSACAQGANKGWVPSHYLGVAEVLRGLAFGYDWLYGALSPEDRAEVRRAIVDYGFGGMSGWGGWDTNANNWSQVCWQGVTAAALAIHEDEPMRAEALLARCVKGLLPSTAVYAPNGSYPEGPGYWNYGTRLFCLLLDQFEHALGTTFGLYELPGVALTGGYPSLMLGPSGKTFNYSDGNEGAPSFYTSLLYLARKARRPDWALREAAVLGADLRGGTSVSEENALWALLWGDALDAAAPDLTPLDWYSGDANAVAVFRESRRPHAAFLGVKGGHANANHGHMDVGSFVFDLDGQRWASDLGMQNYASLESLGKDVVDLWNSGQNSTRWSVFRLGNASHNLVVVDGAREQVAARAAIVPRAEGDVSSAELDLSAVYGSAVCASARRTFTLDRPNRTARIRDVFTGLRPGAALRWQMATKAQVDGIDGGTVRLSLGGSRLDLAMTASVPGAWTVEDVSAGPSWWDCANPGCSLLVYTAAAPATGAATLEAELAAPAARWPAGTTFYGLDQGVSVNGAPVGYGSLQDALAWWTGPTTASTQQDVVPPWGGAAYGYAYVILGTGKTKVTATCSFPDVPVAFGTPTTACNLRFGGNARVTVPDATVYGGSFAGNSRGLALLDGTWRFVRSRNGITFNASAVEEDRGVALAGRLVADADVALDLKATFVANCRGAGVHRISGDASAFKGSVRTVKPSYGAGTDPGEQHIRLELTSPAALGDPSFPRPDAVVLADGTRLVMSPRVVQDGTRGIALDLAAGGRAYLLARADGDWTLAAPLAAPRGTLVKSGPGIVTLARAYVLPALAVEDGRLGLADGVTVTAATFSVDGVARPAGVYGSAEASARHPGVQKDAALTGFGVLRVLSGPPARSVIFVR